MILPTFQEEHFQGIPWLRYYNATISFAKLCYTIFYNYVLSSPLLQLLHGEGCPTLERSI